MSRVESEEEAIIMVQLQSESQVWGYEGGDEAKVNSDEKEERLAIPVPQPKNIDLSNPGLALGESCKSCNGTMCRLTYIWCCGISCLVCQLQLPSPG